MLPSAALFGFLRGWEKLRLSAYPDAGGKPTIGYGHLILPGELVPATLTQEAAENLLATDVLKAAGRVNKLLIMSLPMNQFDALCSFEYNEGRLSGSTLLKCVNMGHVFEAANEFGKWNKVHNDAGELVVCPGLTKRRAGELQIYQHGDYSARP